MMAMLSDVHHRFSAEPWQADIHPWWWQERPRQGPWGYSHEIAPWGPYPYRPGCQRYRCTGCKRTFNDLTETLLPQRPRPLASWMLATLLWCRAWSSRRMARERGGHIRTSERWCWWLRHAAVSCERHRQWEGTLEADALSHTVENKGQATQGGKKVWGRRARGCRKQRAPGRGP